MNNLLNLAKKFQIYIKYVIAGGTAAIVNIAFLYLFTDIIGIYYLISTTIAFIIAYFVSFYLQKFWTFRDNSKDQLARQMSVYFIVGLANLAVNDAGMYILVDWVKLYHILAQIIMGALIAISSFLIYKYMIFKESVKSV